MIKATIHADKKGVRWTVHVFFAVSHYDVDEIMRRLWELRCPSNFAARAYSNLSSGDLDNGLTYSNFVFRESVMVVGMASSAEEFINTFQHEMMHLGGQISSAMSIDPAGEPIGYFMGEVAMKMYPHIRHLLCDCCRRKLSLQKPETYD